MVVSKSSLRRTDVPYALAMMFFAGMTTHEGYEMTAFEGTGHGKSIRREGMLPWTEGEASGKVPATETLTAAPTATGTDFTFSCEVDLTTMPAEFRASNEGDLQTYVDENSAKMIEVLGGNILS